MKYILIYTLLGLSVHFSFTHDTEHVFVSPFTHEVYYRYYLIKRCEEPVQLLIQQPALWQSINFDALSTECFETTHVQDKLLDIKKTHDITALIQLWDELNTHRHVDNPFFERDFITLIFMLYGSLKKSTYKTKRSSNAFLSIEKMLYCIDKNIDTFYTQSSQQKSYIYKMPVVKDVNIDDITFTYYLIQRLSKPLCILSLIQQENSVPLTQHHRMIEIDICSLEKEICFSHERINTCYTQILLDQNIKPLLQLWHEFAHFRYAGEHNFIKEMLAIILIIHKDLLLSYLHEKPEEIIVNETSTISELCEHIDELPLDTILHAIEFTADKIILFKDVEPVNKNSWLNLYTPMLFALPFIYIISKQCAL